MPAPLLPDHEEYTGLPGTITMTLLIIQADKAAEALAPRCRQLPIWRRSLRFMKILITTDWYAPDREWGCDLGIESAESFIRRT